MTIFPIQKTPLKLGATSWFTAKRGVISSSNLVSRWENLANSQNPYTQGTTSSQPTLTTLRSLPVLSFTGSPGKVMTTSLSPTNGSRTLSCYTVSMVDRVDAGTVNVAFASLFLTRYEPTTGSMTSFINVGGGYEPRLSFAAPSNSVPNIRASFYNNTNGSHSFEFNGGTPLNNTRTPSGSGLGTCQINNDPGVPAAIFYMHEQVWFDRVLTASEDLEMNRWLANEWGIPI